ncbi:Carbon-nitrogen hydrolase [Lunasporangiospora selenospora]|uniref:Carbon-nitrogen hydrolase n=1 Tax=Lunasporangiospora selenospora TaxID=979761 RepID=A0A9P6FPF3_9FUNG|nr:Carbon-nitrogen hydrolase [Lunasporangiospora selenospora]
MVGYPEKRVVAEAGSEEEKEEYFNSTCLVSPKGTLVSTYSKTFLYYTDENWAQEGPGFQSTDIEGLGKVGFGICMDVNPRQFKAPFEAFEFSNFHLDQKSKLILCSMAWNKAEEESVSATTSTTNPATTTTATTTTTTTTATQSTPGSTPGEEGPNRNQKEDGNDNDSDMWEDEDNDETDADGIQDQMTQYETIQYWAVRMSPYYRQKTKPFQEAYVVIANRIGREPGACFVGSSCVLHLGKSGPKVLGVLPVNVEGLLSVEI